MTSCEGSPRSTFQTLDYNVLCGDAHDLITSGSDGGSRGGTGLLGLGSQLGWKLIT